MKIFVNSLSAFRILAAFALLPILEFQLMWWAFALFAIAGITDFFDGLLAKQYNVITKLGGVMDHMGDKLLVLTTSVMLAVILNSWFITIPVILMIGRNLYISGLREFLGTQKIEMPVPKHRMSWGKVAAFTQMMALGGILLAICVLPYGEDSELFGEILYYFLLVGIAGLWAGLGASLISATQYTMDFWEKFKKLK